MYEPKVPNELLESITQSYDQMRGKLSSDDQLAVFRWHVQQIEEQLSYLNSSPAIDSLTLEEYVTGNIFTAARLLASKSIETYVSLSQSAQNAMILDCTRRLSACLGDFSHWQPGGGTTPKHIHIAIYHTVVVLGELVEASYIVSGERRPMKVVDLAPSLSRQQLSALKLLSELQACVIRLERLTIVR